MSTSICGTSKIAGFRFSLYPMSDQFVELILNTLEKVDTSKVWMKTDDISTCIRGKIEHVFDVAKAVYVYAASTGSHVVLNGTFSIGCPGDTEGNVYMSEDDIPLNERNVQNFQLEAPTQFALYPMSNDNYMEIIAHVIQIAQQKEVFAGGTHYASRLEGDVHKVFSALQDSFRYAQEQASHVNMTVNVSANSPSRKAI